MQRSQNALIISGILPMSKKRLKFTWHYYLMALGMLMVFLALSLSSWEAAVSGLAFAVISHPVIQFKLPTRTLFLMLFMVFYIMSFPEPNVIRGIMDMPVT